MSAARPKFAWLLGISIIVGTAAAAEPEVAAEPPAEAAAPTSRPEAPPSMEVESEAEIVALPDTPEVTAVTEPPEAPDLPSAAPWGPFRILGREIEPGSELQLSLQASESFAGSTVEVPVTVKRGATPGPTLCLTAGIHGDELNGIEIVRAVMEETEVPGLSGTLIGVPVVNLHGFRRSSRYLPDRRDLNRFFPGHPAGSSASRIANRVFEGVVRHCDYLVDFHTGSFHRTNIPQVRADLTREPVLELAKQFAVGVVVHSEGRPGTLRRASVDAGVQAITYEAGEPMRFRPEEIDRGVQGLRNLLASLEMTEPRGRRRTPVVYYRSRWIRVNEGGVFLTRRELGDRVRQGDVLGTVTDPVANERSEVIAPFTGRIIGMALSQVVIPGFAAFHVGIDEPGADAGIPLVLPPSDALGSPDVLDPDEQPE